jgi:hypothetical protein
VVIDKVDVPLLEPGMTELEDKLHEVLAGKPPHASLTGLENDPPTWEIVKL